jgi:hypothetical protein
MRKSVGLMASAVAVLLGGNPLAAAPLENRDEIVVHVPNRLQAQEHQRGHKPYAYVRGAHREISREPPGGLVQDRGLRESVGRQPESLAPLNSR